MSHEAYISVKRVIARKGTRAEYELMRNRFPCKGDCEEEGYIIKHMFNSVNDDELGADFAFLPTLAFNSTYRKAEKLSLGDAVELLRRGLSVARAKWEGAAWLELDRGFEAKSLYGDMDSKATLGDCLFIKRLTGEMHMYNLTVEDTFALDWLEVETPVSRRLYGGKVT